MQAHEVEILLKEKYGTRPGDRYYVKPPDRSNIMVIEEGMQRNFLSWLPEHVLLPQGYPNSVSKDYTAYQIFDTAQAFCSTIMGTLATQEVLRGMGVGNESATPMAATVTWVFKDGCGHIGRILFAYTRGAHLDAFSKKWRLYADVLNNAAMCIEMVLPASYTTLSLCISTSMKAIVGVAGSATRIALTQHHALRNNLADVAAKDAAQETAVNLLASCVALIILNTMGNHFILFFFLMCLHITFNYMAVRAVCLRTLNEPRYLQVIHGYVRHEIIPAPCPVNHMEPLFFYQMGNNCLDYKICGFSIKMGQSIKKVVKQSRDPKYFRHIVEVYKNRNYLLCPHISKRHMYVLIREQATQDDILKAYFHAVLLSAVICAINDTPLSLYSYADNRRPFADVCSALHMADWTRDNADEGGFLVCSRFQYNPSPALMAFVDTMVHKEWYRFRAGLITGGWDPTKHLLLLDEWRVTDHIVTPKRVLIADEIEHTKSTMLSALGAEETFRGDAVKQKHISEAKMNPATDVGKLEQSLIEKGPQKTQKKKPNQTTTDIPGVQATTHWPGHDATTDSSADVATTRPATDKPGDKDTADRPRYEATADSTGVQANTHQPGHEATKDKSSGEGTKDKSSGEVTKDKSSGEATKDKSLGEATKDKSSGEATKDKSSGEATTDSPGHGATADRSADEATTNRPENETTTDGSAVKATTTHGLGDEGIKFRPARVVARESYEGDLRKVFSNPDRITDKDLQDPYNLIKEKEA